MAEVPDLLRVIEECGGRATLHDFYERLGLESDESIKLLAKSPVERVDVIRAGLPLAATFWRVRGSKA